MQALDLAALRRLASIETWEQEQAIHAGQQCPDCGAPIAGGILALHRHCPEKERAPRPALSRSRPGRKRGHKHVA